MLPRLTLHVLCYQDDPCMQSTHLAKSAPPITVNLIVKSDEQNIKHMKYCYPMSLIRLANSWRIFDSPRQFMDLIHGASLIRLANSWTSRM